ncbi:MAG: hypothetical protein HQ564_04235 [Candidatus Saganbacteria bacterium]|nr:hypothetical protein [Candidatus Saganbacteria bacterium]
MVLKRKLISFDFSMSQNPIQGQIDSFDGASAHVRILQGELVRIPKLLLPARTRRGALVNVIIVGQIEKYYLGYPKEAENFVNTLSTACKEKPINAIITSNRTTNQIRVFVFAFNKSGYQIRINIGNIKMESFIETDQNLDKDNMIKVVPSLLLNPWHFNISPFEIVKAMCEGILGFELVE